MEHVGWAQRHTVPYYLRLANVLNPTGASARLASDEILEVLNPRQDISELKRFVCAFLLTTRISEPFQTNVYISVTSAASVDDHNKSSFQITVYYYTQRLLYSARSAHQKPPLQRVSSFYT